MYQAKRWTIAEAHPAATELAERLKTSPLIAQMLVNRGIGDADAGRDFLRPNLKMLHEPALLAGLRPAADRIARAVRDKEKVVIYGDYDVDGITATAILWHAIKLLGGEVDYYVPHRIDEGYGLNAEAVRAICAEGAKLIVTVDCGVTAVEPVRIARERGTDVIVTDHHEFKDQLPDCVAIVHPRSPLAVSPPYPNPDLCGAGVAFKLAWAVGQAMNGSSEGRVSESLKHFLIDATALAALGTIADVVPLTGENRVLAHFGLGGLKHSKLTGIRALIASSGLDGQKLDSYHVGFLLAPRLNACGRMGHARLAVEMLTTADESRASEIAVFLDQQNRQRQQIEKQILEEAIEQTTSRGMDNGSCRAICLASDQWHAGVIGIVASRLVDRFHRPTILVALNGEIGQGSGRSISGFHLAKALDACTQHLIAHGGHHMAAGLKVRSENFEKFQRAFLDHACERIDSSQLIPELRIDCLAELKHMSEALVHDLKRLGPFGHANRKPLLCCRNVQLAGPARKVGKTGDHLQLHVRQGNVQMKCIAFGRGELFDQLQSGTMIDIAFEPQINEWNGRTSVELDVKDLQIQ